jgi:hypothetical protein
MQEHLESKYAEDCNENPKERQGIIRNIRILKKPDRNANEC